MPKLPYPEYLALLAEADIILDTLHFGGGITTYDTIAMNAPLVTLPTTYSCGRYAYAAYQQMGLEEGIATSADDYINRVLRFANDSDFRNAFRVKLEESSEGLFEDQLAVREFMGFIEQVVAEVA